MKSVLTLLGALVLLNGYSSNLQLSQPLCYYEDDQAYAVFNISWDNAWKNDRNQDAAWVFFKTSSADETRHIRVAAQGHQVVEVFAPSESEGFTIKTPADQAGLFIQPQGPIRGHVSMTVKIALLSRDFDGLNAHANHLTAHGVEMVYIPEGSFYIGDESKAAIEHGGLYAPNTRDGEPGLLQITSEQELSVGSEADLHYQNPRGYSGDQAGPIPAAFPKGFAGFYMMKYELRAGQYVKFLNFLTESQRSARIVHEHPAYQESGGSIEFVDGQFSTAYPNKPAYFVGWADAMAFADWAGLRPMTELEFAKAARGAEKPESEDFPWSTTSKLQMQRLPNANGELEMRNGLNEAELSDDTRHYFGASPYWVMDLAGSLWERTISIGHPRGRAFTGQHVDGKLSPEGMADVAEWPSGAEDEGGFGFRGGGFYGYNRMYHTYNPFSPVAYRPYGGWAGGDRTKAYGTRLVRSAP